MDYKLFYDTNALLNLQAKAFDENFVISQKTLEEVEKIKSSSSKDGEIKYKARQLAHLLDERYGDYEVVQTTNEIKHHLVTFNLDESSDNLIIAAASYINKLTPVIVVSDDINVKFISRNVFGLPTKGSNEIDLVADINVYTGYKDITLTDDEMSNFYLHLSDNQFECLKNEYLIVRKSDGDIVDYRRWNGAEYVTLSYKQVNSPFMGKVKPRNPQQTLAFDMLQSKYETIKILSGKAGSGKDFLMISNALKLIEDGRFDRLVYIRNPIGVKDAAEIGFIPGDQFDKMKPYIMPLADHLGGEIGLESQMRQGNIEALYLGYIRGRSLKNSCVYVSEAENLTREHVQLLISRIDEGSELWINGDFKQTDSPIFRMNNGLLSAVQRLAGNERFGYVRLEKTERSETAALADMLD